MEIRLGFGHYDGRVFYEMQDWRDKVVVVEGTGAEPPLFCVNCTKMIVIGLAVNCRHVREVQKFRGGVHGSVS